MLPVNCTRSHCIFWCTTLASILLGVWLSNRKVMDDSMIPELRRAGVHIKHKDNVKSLLKEFVAGGKARLQVVADFDRTLSKYKHNGELVPTCHGIINSNQLMPESFKKTAEELFHKYYPIEINHNLTPEEKIPHMIEWWTQAHELMMNSGLTRSTLDRMISSADIILRDGSSAMFDSLQHHQVPLLIFSAGVGDVIDGILRNKNEFHDNMKIVSNFMDFDSEGKVIGFKGEIIHIYNKNEGAIHDSDYFKELEHRKNVLLLGDSVGDLTMARGVEDGKILRIGFLNDKVEERLENYINLYDVVLTGDETMDVANAILREVFG